MSRIFICLNIFIIILLSGIESQSQNSIFHYYRLERQARIFNEQQLLDSSLVYYLRALKYNQECPNSTLHSALRISKKLNNDSAEIILTKEIDKQKTKFNMEYSREINKIFNKDQKARSPRNMRVRKKYLNCIASGDCSESQLSKYLNVLNAWNKTDSTNIYKLISLMDKFGFPGENIVGESSYNNAFLILLHFDRDTNNTILGPTLESALSKGQIKPRDYAWIIDRRSMSVGKNPPYFHIPHANYELLSQEEKDSVDKRRSLIGLGKVADSQIIIKMKNGFKVKYLD